MQTSELHCNSIVLQLHFKQLHYGGCESAVSPGNDILCSRPPTLFQICAIFLQISLSSKPNILTILVFKTKYSDNTFLQNQISWQYFSLKPNILTIFLFKTKYILSLNIWNDMLCSSHPTPHFTLLKLLATATPNNPDIYLKIMIHSAHLFEYYWYFKHLTSINISISEIGG